MRVDICESGVSAIELAGQNEYDIIFLDHLMPDMDGLEAAAVIRCLSSYYETSPIIALTANALTGMREMYIENGFSEFLAKPVEVPKLECVLGEWISAEKQVEVETLAPVADNRLAVLKVFVNDARVKLAEIPKCLESGDTKLFITFVHALKSASANVGETVLSEAAGELESAAKKGDNDYIRANIGGFLTALQEVIDKSSELVGDYGNDVSPISKETLLKLKTALVDIDISGIDSIMAEVGDNKGMEAVAKCVLEADYDRAVELIDEIL
jgi:CheY-like chemotaxis protein